MGGGRGGSHSGHWPLHDISWPPHWPPQGRKAGAATGAAVLNHKPTKVRDCASRTRGVFIRSWLPAKDSEVKRKPLQLERTYHRTLRKTKTAVKATGNHAGKT